MKLFVLLVLSACFVALPATAQKKPAKPAPTRTAAPAPTPTPGRPDLVIEAFGFTGPTATSVPKPTCDPKTIVYSFAVTVANRGSGPSPSSIALGGKPLVSVSAQARAGWATTAPLPEIAAGKTTTVSVDILYLDAEPSYMVKANHPFVATVDPDNLVAETDETNNSKGPLTIAPPAGCEKLVKRR